MPTSGECPPKDARILARASNARHALETVVQQLTSAMGQRSIARRHFTAARRLSEEVDSGRARYDLTVESALTPALVIVDQILNRYNERIDALEVAYSECLARFASVRDELREQALRNCEIADELEGIFASQCSPTGIEGGNAADDGTSEQTAKLKAKAAIAQRRALAVREVRVAEELERTLHSIPSRSVAAVSDAAAGPVAADPAAHEAVSEDGDVGSDEEKASGSDAKGVASPARKRARSDGCFDPETSLSQIERVDGAEGAAGAAAEPRREASPSLSPSPQVSSSLSQM
jgi:hypothetical protein